jgi:hypothetical protein
MMLAWCGRGTSCHVWLRCKASNSSCMAANHIGSRRAARAEAGNGDGAEVDAVQTYSSEGYRILGQEMPARAWVRGPAAGGRGYGDGAPTGGEAALPSEDGAAPELRLEGDAGGVGVGVGAGSPETWLEGDAGNIVAAPELELEGAAGDDVAVPESELEGTAVGGPVGAGGRHRGPLVAEGGTSTTYVSTKGKQCSSKYTCLEVMTR